VEVGRDLLRERGKPSSAAPGRQRGSDNLVLGSEQTYESYGSLLAGTDNRETGPYSDVFGFENWADGSEVSVTGGVQNKAPSRIKLSVRSWRSTVAWRRPVLSRS
jgi:hypothetical protein